MSQVLHRAAAWLRRAGAAATVPARSAQGWRLDSLLVGLLLLILLPVTPAITASDTEYAPPLLDPRWGWHEAWWAWALQFGLILPLVWRRRWPLPVFLVTGAVAFVQWLAGPELYGDVAVLIALYTVVAYEPRRWALASAGAVAAIGLLLAIQRWAFDTGAVGPSTIVLTLMVVVPVTLGLVTRNRNQVLVATRDAAVREERARIAGEMHDVLAHSLSVMVALSDGARFAIDRDPAAARGAVEQIGRTGREGLGEMRRLLGALHNPGEAAPLQPQPGLEQLEALAAPVRASGIEVVLHVDRGLAPDVPAGLALAVHRIVQEALTNVLRHAPRATAAEVRVGREGAALLVRIDNDGGRVSAAATSGSGAGVPGMAQRAALLGGACAAGPSANGWTVQATLPLRDPAEETDEARGAGA